MKERRASSTTLWSKLAKIGGSAKLAVDYVFADTVKDKVTNYSIVTNLGNSAVVAIK